MGRGYVEDWATKAARRILAEFPLSQSRRHPTEDRIAAIIATHAEPILKLLREANNGRHSRGYMEEYPCDQQPCPKSDEEEPGDGRCLCGADAWNARVNAALAGERK